MDPLTNSEKLPILTNKLHDQNFIKLSEQILIL